MSSYLTLEKGTPVLSSDGERVGVVEHVLADFEDDIFDGVVLDRSVLPGGHRFADADQIAEIRDDAVVLGVDRAAAERLPEPSANPGSAEAEPGRDEQGSRAGDRLRRAWDLISGNY